MGARGNESMGAGGANAPRGGSLVMKKPPAQQVQPLVTNNKSKPIGRAGVCLVKGNYWIICLIMTLCCLHILT